MGTSHSGFKQAIASSHAKRAGSIFIKNCKKTSQEIKIIVDLITVAYEFGRAWANVMYEHMQG